MVQDNPQFSLTANSSTSNPIPSLSNNRSHASPSNASTSQTHRHSFDFSLFDVNHFESAKETEIIEVESNLHDHETAEDNEEEEEENTSLTDNHSKPPVPASRTIYDVLSPIDPQPSIPVSSSSLTSVHDQQIIDIDTALREIISGIQTVEESHAQYFRSVSSSNAPSDIDAPDLVLNLPKSNGLITSHISKSFDESLLTKPSLSIAHSTTIIDLTPSSRSNSSSPELTRLDKIPPRVMKKPEKTLHLIERLGLNRINESLYVEKKSSLRTCFNINHRENQSISISASSKATQV